jgi:ribonucleotide reductase beta subunit family protein with ferritin-like domain
MSIFEQNIAYRPFKYNWAVEAEKTHRIDMMWHEDQINLDDDLRQFTSEGGLETKHVSHESNKNIVDKLLMLFTEMDVAVGTGYGKLLPHVHNNEIKTLWYTFACREVTHQRGYALAAETFGYTESKWSEFKEYKQMQDKINILNQDIGDLSDKLNFAKQLATILLGEGIALFGAFAVLLNFRRFGLMQNFNNIVEWSTKDEDAHVDGNIKVLNEVRKELNAQENNELTEFILKTIDIYVEAEHKFLDLVYTMGPQEDLTLEDTKQFINYLKELRKFQLGLQSSSKLLDNPLPWIDHILSGSTHTNFFEAKVVDYSHNDLGNVDYRKYKNVLNDKEF